jgi:kinetochor protein Mis14/NSL1
VFQTTAENITINGLDPSPELLSTILSAGANSEGLEIEEHEPFNTKLFEKAKDLARQEEDLIEEIAGLRRKMPGVVVEGVKREYSEGVEGDEEVLRRVERRDVGGEKGDVVGIGKLLRQDEVEERWQRGVKGLEGLMRSMPEMVARKERAEKAENYVVNGEKR